MQLNISVIIPVYNAEEMLEKAVRSTLQFKEVKEVILVEDQSPDQSLQIAQKLVLEDSRVKLYQHADKGNHGAGATRNLGLEKATQEYIAFLDADDYYLPNRFDAEKELFKNPKIEGVFGAIGTEFLTEKGKEEFKAKFSSEITTVNYPAEGKEVFEGLIGVSTKVFGSFFHLNGLTVKKSSLKKIGINFNPALKVHQDSDFIIKLAYNCYLKSGIIDKAIAIRGVHDNNRITKINIYSAKYFQNQQKLNHSLYQWSKKIVKEANYKEQFDLKHISYTSATKLGLSKYIYYFVNVLKHPKLLKTRYRFIALHTDKKSR